MTLAGLCNDSTRRSSLLDPKHFQPQRDPTEHGDMQAEGSSACLLMFAFLTCLFFFLGRQFLPERVEFNSGK